MDIDAISDKYLGQALDRVIKKKILEASKAPKAIKREPAFAFKKVAIAKLKKTR